MDFGSRDNLPLSEGFFECFFFRFSLNSEDLVWYSGTPSLVFGNQVPTASCFRTPHPNLSHHLRMALHNIASPISYHRFTAQGYALPDHAAKTRRAFQCVCFLISDRFPRAGCCSRRGTWFMKYGYGYGLRLVMMHDLNCDSSERK